MNTDRYALSTWESFELLRSASIGRLCVIEQAYPIAVPVNFRIVGSGNESRIVVRTAPNSLIGRYQGLASLEVDDLKLNDGTAWSVIVRGTLSKVQEGNVLDGTVLPDPKPLVSEGRHLWVTLETSSISGRRFTVRRSDDGFSVDWQSAAR